MYTFSVSADVCIVVLYCNVLYFIFVLQSFVVLQPASGCTAGCVILVCCTVVLLYHCVVLLTQYLSITFRDVLPACCLSVNRKNTFPTTHRYKGSFNALCRTQKPVHPDTYSQNHLVYQSKVSCRFLFRNSNRNPSHCHCRATCVEQGPVRGEEFILNAGCVAI